MKRIKLSVGGAPVGKAVTWSYPYDDGNLYVIPTYNMKIEGLDDKGKFQSKTYEVIRFGVNRKTLTSSPVIVGLAQKQTHTIKRWIKTYSVHSFPSSEDGAWQVYDNFLIHDGPDKPMKQYYATAGCIEICGGPNGFVTMNDFIISLSGSTAATRDAKLTQIGASGLMTISYDAATRPPLVKKP
jgi:hypothetical protein